MSDSSKEITVSLEESVIQNLEPAVKSYSTADGQKLQVTYDSLFLTHTFQPRQLVKWKLGLKNKKLPKEGQPAIVLEVLTTPLDQVERDHGSPYFREPLDIVLGVTDEDGDFLAFHFDKRRFEPYNG